MQHISHWLRKLANRSTASGKEIEVWLLNHQQDEVVLSAWAKHFREHYCPDNIIDMLREGTGLSRKEYFNQLIFPDQQQSPGPAIRSGDFCELLVADYLEFSLGYWVPRARMEAKAVRNESVKGCDVIGFKVINQDSNPSPNDEMVVYETKGKLTGSHHNLLQTAVEHSAKDSLRKAEALNFLKRRLIEKQNRLWERVQRFQNPVDHPYVEKNGAAAILSTSVLEQSDLESTDTNEHPNDNNLKLLLIHGANLMPFVHALYDRAADEA